MNVGWVCGDHGDRNGLWDLCPRCAEEEISTLDLFQYSDDRKLCETCGFYFSPERDGWCPWETTRLSIIYENIACLSAYHS